MADQHGHAVHFFERDCSAQRRRQKIIEEAPCAVLNDTQRSEIGAAAVRAALSIGYEGAGTVEFLLADNGEFYFLEMNTRLQVEHPVTEMITGHDLVVWARVAMGDHLPQQSELSFQGHAIEARIYAEAPHQQFLPQTGAIHLWKPSNGPDRQSRFRHPNRTGSQLTLRPHACQIDLLGTHTKKGDSTAQALHSELCVAGARNQPQLPARYYQHPILSRTPMTLDGWIPKAATPPTATAVDWLAAAYLLRLAWRQMEHPRTQPMGQPPVSG